MGDTKEVLPGFILLEDHYFVKGVMSTPQIGKIFGFVLPSTVIVTGYKSSIMLRRFSYVLL
jgi:hypothetical protein